MIDMKTIQDDIIANEQGEDFGETPQAGILNGSPDLSSILVLTPREEAIKRSTKKGEYIETFRGGAYQPEYGRIALGWFVVGYFLRSHEIQVDASFIPDVDGIAVAHHSPLWTMQNLAAREIFLPGSFPEVERVYEFGPAESPVEVEILGKKIRRPEEQREPKYSFDPGVYVVPEPVREFDRYLDYDPAQVQLLRRSSKGLEAFEDISTVGRLAIRVSAGDRLYLASLKPVK